MQMNIDRFLTRVFDRQEKKMLYPIGCWDLREQRSVLLENGERVEIICLCPHTQEITYNKVDHDGDHLGHIEFGDRFVPMMCTGFREDYGYENVEDGMPAFEFDIIQSHMSELFLITLKDGCWVANLIRDKKIINRPICDLASLEGRFSIKGNKFEQPELMGVKA
jgi:hypothetical protein